MKYRLRTIDDIGVLDLKEMICESKVNGHKTIERLQDEWLDGINRFDKPGELLVGFLEVEQLVAIGGINIDPYHPEKNYGRIRHVYVMNSARRKKLGSFIVEELLNRSMKNFDLITLRTPDDGSADVFYEGIGFTKCSTIASVSHIFRREVIKPGVA